MSFVQNILNVSSTCGNGTEEVTINKPRLVLVAMFIDATQQRNCCHSDKEYHLCIRLLCMLR